jgi:hypothetical protein
MRRARQSYFIGLSSSMRVDHQTTRTLLPEPVVRTKRNAPSYHHAGSACVAPWASSITTRLGDRFVRILNTYERPDLLPVVGDMRHTQPAASATQLSSVTA